MPSPTMDAIMADIKVAMKARDKDQLLTLRTLHAEIKNISVNAGRALKEEDVVTVVTRAVKQRSEALEIYRGAGRDELVAKEEVAIARLRSYLPRQLERDEIVEIARLCIAAVGAEGKAQMGEVMKHMMPRVKGKADGKLVNQIVTELLG